MSITLYKDRPVSTISLIISDEDKRQYQKTEIDKLNKEIERLNNIIITYDLLIKFREMLLLKCAYKSTPITIIQCSEWNKQGKCRNCSIRNNFLKDKLNAKSL